MRDLMLLIFGIPSVLLGIVELALMYRRREDLAGPWSRRDFFHRNESHASYNGRQLFVQGSVAILLGGLALVLRFI
jgi:hypothetical protein